MLHGLGWASTRHCRHPIRNRGSAIRSAPISPIRPIGRFTVKSAIRNPQSAIGVAPSRTGSHRFILYPLSFSLSNVRSRLAVSAISALLCVAMKRLYLTILAVLSALPALAQDGKPTTETRLIFSQEFLRAGDTVWAGIELKMAPGWHTYWRNGGDAGLPTTITWSLPPGVTAGQINWPIPEKTVTPAGDNPLYTYGYQDRVVLLVPIKIANGMLAGPYQVSAEVAWMECKDTCNRYTATVRGRLNLGSDERPSADAPLIDKYRALLPKTVTPAPAIARWLNSSTDSPRAVIIDWESANASADFFPYEGQAADVQGATEISRSGQGHVLLRKMLKQGAAPGRKD